MMKKTFLTIFITTFLSYAFAQSQNKDFKYTVQYERCESLEVVFELDYENRSDADSIEWDFGDGEFKKLVGIRTNYIYKKPGIFSVTLTIWEDGLQYQIIKQDLIKVKDAPNAFFSHSMDTTEEIYAPIIIDFYNETLKGEGDSLKYEWEIFNNNGYDYYESSDTSLSVLFSSSGLYSITLKVSDEKSSTCFHYKEILVKDSIQKDEFGYITSNCESGDSCMEGVNYKIENDTLKLFGQVERNCCTNSTAVIIDKNDTIKIPTFESGLLCECICTFCFEINIPSFKRDSCVIIFDNEITKVNSNINSISNKEIITEIRIKPNPFKELIIIDFDNFNCNNYFVEIFNIHGQLIKSQSNLNQSTDIDMTNIAKGIYLIKVTDNGMILKSEKIIKE
jgi:PKD repeat protein